MTFTEYILPTIYNLPNGQSLKCFLYVDDTVAALTIPLAVNIITLSPIKESVDITVGEIDLDTVTVTVADTIDSFWWDLIEGNPAAQIQMMFILTEGETDTFLYRGSLFRESVTWRELYISDGNYVRSVDIQLVSPILALKELKTADFWKFMLDVDNQSIIDNLGSGNIVTVYSTVGKNDRLTDTYATTAMIKLRTMFGALCDFLFGVDDGECVSGGADIRLYNGAEWYNAIDGYFEIFKIIRATELNYYLAGKWFDGLPVTVNNSCSWIEHYYDCYSLLQSMCGSLGLIPRYYYGDENGIYRGDARDKHTIQLVVRGRMGDTLTNTKLIESTLISNSTLTKFNIITHGNGVHQDALSYYIKGVYGTAAEYDQETNFDIDGGQYWDLLYYLYTGEELGIDGGAIKTTNHFSWQENVSYYDYSQTPFAWENVADPSEYTNLIEAITKYLFFRFSGRRKEYTRVYGQMKFSDGTTETQQNLKLMQLMTINGETYYATESTKDVELNRAIVKWIQQ